MKRINDHILLGQFGEKQAKLYLEKHEFTILETNWRYKKWEVDIIASKLDILHFIEVKTRSSARYGLPETAVSVSKMNRLKNAAEIYQLAFPIWKKIQFDVIAILLSQNEIQELHVNWDVYF